MKLSERDRKSRGAYASAAIEGASGSVRRAKSVERKGIEVLLQEGAATVATAASSETAFLGRTTSRVGSKKSKKVGAQRRERRVLVCAMEQASLAEEAIGTKQSTVLTVLTVLTKSTSLTVQYMSWRQAEEREAHNGRRGIFSREKKERKWRKVSGQGERRERRRLQGGHMRGVQASVLGGVREKRTRKRRESQGSLAAKQLSS